MAVALAHPYSGLTAGITGINIGGTIQIKVGAAKTRFTTRYANVTGDGDAAPAFVTNKYLYGSLRVFGWMASSYGLNLDAVRQGTNISCVLTYSTGQSVTGTLIVHEQRQDKVHQASNIPVWISGIYTGAITDGTTPT